MMRPQSKADRKTLPQQQQQQQQSGINRRPLQTTKESRVCVCAFRFFF